MQKLLRPSCLLCIVTLLVWITAGVFSHAEENSAASRSTKAYIVKEGDTLWDISKRFYNRPGEWPRIWGKNPYIQNPHLIYPGEPINLYSYAEGVPAAAIPSPPEKEQLQTAEHAERGPTAVATSEFTTSGILSEEEFKRCGGIVGSYEDKQLLSQGDVIYLHFTRDEKCEVGKRYGVFRAGQMVYHPRTGAGLGRIYTLLGYAEILDRGEGRAVSARIVSSRDTIQVGDGVREFEPVHTEVVPKPSQRPLEGYIVAHMDDRQEIAQHDGVFIDLGIQDGIEVGDELSVVVPGKSIKGSMSEGEVRLPDRKVAKLVVVKTDRTASTALVTESQDSFLIGALVRTRIAQPVQ